MNLNLNPVLVKVLSFIGVVILIMYVMAIPVAIRMAYISKGMKGLPEDFLSRFFIAWLLFPYYVITNTITKLF